MRTATPIIMPAALLALMLGNAGIAAGEQLMPDRFIGVWEPTPRGQTAVCKDIDFDIRMEVFADRMDGYDLFCSYGDVTVLDPSDENSAVALELICAEEGEEWSDVQRWQVRDVDNVQMLSIGGLSGEQEYEAFYGRCPDGVARNPWAEPSQAQAGPRGGTLSADQFCYGNPNTDMKLTISGSGDAEFHVDTVQGPTHHMCYVAGTATAISGGFRYTEQLDGADVCQLDIMIGEDGSVMLHDPDWLCKQRHCGQRAVLDGIEFSPSDRRPC